MPINDERGQLIMRRFGMHPYDLMLRLRDMQQRVIDDKQRLVAAHQSWNDQNETRLTSVDVLFNSLDRTQVGIALLAELCDDEWYARNYADATSQRKINQTIGLERLIKYNFGMDFFNGIETCFRLVLRALDPSACNNGTGAFKAIYEYLLSPRQLNIPEAERVKALELLNLARLIRNLIHTSGNYFSNKETDEIITYRNKTYTLRHGRPVDFVSWELLLQIVDDIRELLIRVISHPSVSALGHVPDPYAMHYGL